MPRQGFWQVAISPRGWHRRDVLGSSPFLPELEESPVHSIRRKAVLTLTLCWALAVSAGGSDAPSQPKGQAADAGAIQTVFAQYKDALLEGDGQKAADVVSAGTIGFYDGIVTHVLTTPRAELMKLDFISKFMVLRIRHESTRAQLSRMTGRELLAIGVARGWISKSSVANIERLVNIRVHASEATAAMSMAPEFPAFRFLKEAGQWKLDLAASFPLANNAMKEEIKKAGLTEDEFIIRTLNALSSKPVDDRIYSPPPE